MYRYILFLFIEFYTFCNTLIICIGAVKKSLSIILLPLFLPASFRPSLSFSLFLFLSLALFVSRSLSSVTPVHVEYEINFFSGPLGTVNILNIPEKMLFSCHFFISIFHPSLFKGRLIRNSTNVLVSHCLAHSHFFSVPLRTVNTLKYSWESAIELPFKKMAISVFHPSLFQKPLNTNLNKPVCFSLWHNK